MTIDYCYSPHPLDLSYSRPEAQPVEGLCAVPDCHRLAADGCDCCAPHELEAAIDDNDLDLIAYWKEAVNAE